MHCKLLITVLLFALNAQSQAAPRTWKNTNATRSFRGELIKREVDTITIRMMATGKLAVLKPEQLHQSDLEWLRQNHPLDSEKPQASAPDVAAGCFYDTLAFGDDKTTVISKLKESKRFHSELDETFFARTGLNGTFRTTKGNEFFGMQASLYYDWDESKGLKNLSLHGHHTAAEKTETELLPTYMQMVASINKYFGEAKNTASKPEYDALGEGEITFCHVWPLKTGGSLLMGVGKQEGKHVIIARFTREQH